MPHTRRLWTALAAVGLTLATAGALALASPGRSSSAATDCQLSPNGQIKHVINIVFDNVHFSRDNPNVPSDLEQMPHLLNFLKSNGTVFSNYAHTADCAYRERQPDDLHRPLRRPSWSGAVELVQDLQPRRVDRSRDVVHLLDVADHRHEDKPAVRQHDRHGALDGLLGPGPGDGGDTSKITPAPWVPFTRAGCTVGDFSTANMVLENATVDVPTVFGANSAEAAETAANSGPVQGRPGRQVRRRGDPLRPGRDDLLVVDAGPWRISLPDRAGRLQRLPGALRRASTSPRRSAAARTSSTTGTR